MARRHLILAAVPVAACTTPPLPTLVVAVEARVPENDAELVERQYAPVVESLSMKWPSVQRTAGRFTHQAWRFEMALDRPATEADARAFESALTAALQKNSLPVLKLDVRAMPPHALVAWHSA